MTHLTGVIVGAATLCIIGVFHPIVIKFEYYLGKRLWPLFVFVGVAFLAASILLGNQIVSALMGVLGFTCFWSIRELFEQEKRVEQGRFPANPARKR